MNQAAADTFTEELTGFARFLGGQFYQGDKSLRIIHETMDFVSPFRRIWVNLFKQGMWDRFTPFLGKKFWKDVTGKNGDFSRQDAIGRVAAAYTLLGATSMLMFGNDKIKIWPDSRDTLATRALKLQETGEIGGTIQIGDQYIPLSALPPSLSIPLGITAQMLDALDDHAYRIDTQAQTTREDVVMAGLSVFLTAIGDGQWVNDYFRAMSDIRGAMMGTNAATNVGKVLMNMTLAPIKMPDWITRTVDPGGAGDYYIRGDTVLENFRGKVMAKKGLPLVRSEFTGQPIPKLKRFGKYSSYSWFGVDDDVGDFLYEIGFDKKYQGNADRNIYGFASNSKYGVAENYDKKPMNERMIEKFTYHTGTTAIGGRTLQQSIRAFMNKPTTKKLNNTQKAAVVSELLTKYRKRAKELVRYDPEFGISDWQAKVFSDKMVAEGKWNSSEARRFPQKQRKLTKYVQSRYKGEFK
jgi:hypothetical protein